MNIDLTGRLEESLFQRVGFCGDQKERIMKKTTTQKQEIFFPHKTVVVAYGLLHSQPQTHLFYDWVGIYHTDTLRTITYYVLVFKHVDFGT